MRPNPLEAEAPNVQEMEAEEEYLPVVPGCTFSDDLFEGGKPHRERLIHSVRRMRKEQTILLPILVGTCYPASRTTLR